jgi:hypothetical protein
MQLPSGLFYLVLVPFALDLIRFETLRLQLIEQIPALPA